MYTPSQWIAIDAAAQFGMDKLPFEERLTHGRAFVERVRSTDLNEESIKEEFMDDIEKAEAPEMFCKSLLSIKDILTGTPNGHLVGLDAASSGPQLLSVLGGCIKGMTNTGVLGEDVPDLYTTIYKEMDNDELTRTQVKKACVPYVYGSDFAPMAVFGEDAEEFVAGYREAVPFAFIARELLINAWNPTALFHEFVLPDGHIAHIEVRDQVSAVGKLLGKSYTYITEVNKAKSKGKGIKSLAANVTHGWDAFVVRELGGRCNYNLSTVQQAKEAIAQHTVEGSRATNIELKKLETLWKVFNFVSVETLNHLVADQLYGIDDTFLAALLELANSMLAYKPFEVRTTHDEFACQANNVNVMQQTYNNILAESFKSSWLFDIIKILTGKSFHHLKPDFNQDVYEAIKNAKYAIH